MEMQMIINNYGLLQEKKLCYSQENFPIHIIKQIGMPTIVDAW